MSYPTQSLSFALVLVKPSNQPRSGATRHSYVEQWKSLAWECFQRYSSPASASTSAGLSSGAAPQEIQPVPVTPFENLCLSRPGGLPIIEGLRPTDAVVFYYGEYQPQSDNRRKSVAPRPVDYELRPVRGPDGAEKWREEAGTEAKDKQPATLHQ